MSVYRTTGPLVFSLAAFLVWGRVRWGGDREVDNVPSFDLSIIPAVSWNGGSFDSMPTLAEVISHLPAGILAGL